MDAGGHCHRFGIQCFVTGIVEGVDAPFVVCLNMVNRQEKGARPVAAGLGGKQGLSECQGNCAGWWAVRGLWDIARHVQVLDPWNFH